MQIPCLNIYICWKKKKKKKSLLVHLIACFLFYFFIKERKQPFLGCSKWDKRLSLNFCPRKSNILNKEDQTIFPFPLARGLLRTSWASFRLVNITPINRQSYLAPSTNSHLGPRRGEIGLNICYWILLDTVFYRK